MSDTRKAIVRQENGHQVIVLPDDVRIEAEEVYVSHNTGTGHLTISLRPPHSHWADLFAYWDTLDIPQEDLDAFMVERPMNIVSEGRNVYEDEE